MKAALGAKGDRKLCVWLVGWWGRGYCEIPNAHISLTHNCMHPLTPSVCVCVRGTPHKGTFCCRIFSLSPSLPPQLRTVERKKESTTAATVTIPQSVPSDLPIILFSLSSRNVHRKAVVKLEALSLSLSLRAARIIKAFLLFFLPNIFGVGVRWFVGSGARVLFSSIKGGKVRLCSP